VTYSLGVTGLNANNTRYNPATLQVSDADSTGDVIGTLAPSQGSTMRTGAQVLCKGPDGAQRWYTIDPVRSIPGVSLVLQAV
jgi:hypothetical protein